MIDACERTVFRRVLDALLREDHLGLSHNGHLRDGKWCTDTGRARLRLSVRPDGFQHALRSADAVVFAAERQVDTLDGLLDLLTPANDSQAEEGWRRFTAECHGELLARRLSARTRDRVYGVVAAARRGRHTGMPGALLDEVLAARTDHPVHPTSRCRNGLTEADLLRYAPEHAPVFALRWLPARRADLTLRGTLPAWWPSAGDPDTVLLPVHPLTAERLALPVIDTVRIPVRPTLSTRTVALANDPYTHLKLPLPTATLGIRNRRMIAPGTLADGAAMHRLLRRIAASEPRFANRILHADETGYGHADDEARAFLVRRYPADLAESTVVPVAALVAEDPNGRTVAERVTGGDPWPLLAAYLDLLLDWHVFLWLRHGIALEAHQQNIHLVLDPDGGVRLLYKDNDGARLDRRFDRSDVSLHDSRMWTADPGELADVFTTITLHLCAAAPLLGLARRGVPVPEPGPALRPRLIAARDRWGGDPLFTERVLDARTLPVKAMLTAGTLLPKHRIGCADINKYYLRTGPNYLLEPTVSALSGLVSGAAS